jgi:hypothetical protein
MAFGEAVIGDMITLARRAPFVAKKMQFKE